MHLSEYRIDIYDVTGAKLSTLANYEALAFTRQRLQPGGGEFTVRADHPAIQSLQDDCLIEIWRKNASVGLDWYTELTGFYTGDRRFWSGYDKRTVQFAGELDLLRRRTVAWYASVANRTEFSSKPAETIAKTLVEYNAGASATVANGRLRTPATLGITNEADGGRGNVLSYNCAWDNLLSALQKIAGKKGNGDFELLRSGHTGRNFVFYWRPGQLGTDRTATLLFSLSRNNMLIPNYARNWRNRRSVAIVGGQGEKSSRATSIRLASDTTFDFETFVDARDCATALALEDKGDKVLAEAIEEKTIRFDFAKIPSCVYGVHYFLGDRVSWDYSGVSGEVLIDSVTIESSASNPENISVGLKDEKWTI